MQNGNIFRVRAEEDLNEVLDDHTQRLVIVIYSSRAHEPCRAITHKFKLLAEQNPDCFFVYVDVNDFRSSNGKYKKALACQPPKFVYYFNNREVADVEGPYEKSVIETLLHLKKRIEIKKNEIMQKERELAAKKQQEQQEQQERQDQTIKPLEEPQTQEFMLQKIELIRELYTLSAQYGLPLSRKYDLSSPYNDMVTEYKTIIAYLESQPQQPQQSQQPTQPIQESPQNSQQPEAPIPSKSSQSSEQDDTIKKQHQLQQIKELSKLSHMVQMQQLHKLQQLKDLQKFKEQEEKQQKHEDDKNKH